MNNHNHHKEKSLTEYVCPMHQDILREKPGLCPECGMNLVPARKDFKKRPHREDAYNKHAGHQAGLFLRRFWIVLFLTIPILAYSELFERAFGTRAPDFFGRNFVILAIGSIIFFYGGLIFITGAWRELRARLPGMMTLIALAITAAYAFSVFEILRGSPHNLFWELSTLIAIMLLGHWVEMKAVQSARGALKELAKLLPDTAEVIRNGQTRIISISELVSGDTVFIRPGSKVPADGIIIDGQSDLDESIITGESKLVGKKSGERVIAGSINGDGSLTVAVDKIGEATFLAGVMRLVAEAQASKSRLQMLSDRAALYLTVIAILAGATTFIVWILAKGGIVFATERLVAVLVIACPHALGLAVPLVASISTTMAARNGLLIKQRLALEAARAIDIVLFDKTGTLTKGEFGVNKIIPADSFNETDVLAMAGSVNNHSEHPLAKAIVAESRKRSLSFLKVKNFERVAGKGARGTINGKTVSVGNMALMDDLQAPVSNNMKTEIDALSREGKTIIFVASNNRLLGAIALSDIIREESREAVKSLRALGMRAAMITGDSEDVAEWVAKELGIDEYFAKVLPGQKAEKIKTLQQKGYKVAMVGDGVNDAPALTQADLGIAIGAGTNVAIESAGIILVKNDPRDIPKIIKLSRLTYAKMIQNLFWATGYNIVALPLAAGVLVSKGIVLEPALAAVFMSVSTVIVALNALLLRKNNLAV